MKRVFLVDAFALIYRSYFAFIKNPRVTSKGENVSAIMGFMSFLIDLIKKENPSHLAVGFDPPGLTFRHKEFEDYKAHREKTPEPIRFAIPHIQKMLADLKVPTLTFEGFEADDVIGSAVHYFSDPDITYYLVTPDKDYAQLVSDRVFMYKPRRQGQGIEIWTPKEVFERFEITNTSTVIDYLALVGDSVDNIPGVPGVGDKTAKRLLKTFGTLENILKHTHELKGKLKENFISYRDQALLSKKLATIETGIDLKVSLQDLEVSEKPDLQSLFATYDELEFRTLKKKTKELFLPVSGALPLFQNADNSTTLELFEEKVEHQKNLYQIVDHVQFAERLIKKLHQQKEVSVHALTDSHQALSCKLHGISLSYDTHHAYYIPVREETHEILSVFKPFFENTQVTKVSHQAKFDAKVLGRYGIYWEGDVFDTTIAHYLSKPDNSHKITVLAQNLLSFSILPPKKSDHSEDSKQSEIHYSCQVADAVLQLRPILEKELETQKLLKLFREVELPVMAVLLSMERTGVRIELETLKVQSTQLQRQLKSLEAEIFDLSGTPFLITSPKQLGVVLFEQLRISEKPKKTKTGQYATSEDILQKLKSAHPIAGKILDYRSLQKLISTYIETLPAHVNQKTQKIHTTFSQTNTATGRLSSSDPNMQNIPIQSPEGKKIRKAFVPSENDYLLTSADYSQIELRIIAEMSGEPTMLAAFEQDLDIHNTTAANIFGVSAHAITPEQRNQAKTVNFGIIYGVSAYGLSRQIHCSIHKAKEIIDAYFDTFPLLTTYMEKQINLAKEQGFVSTILGRKRLIPEIHSQNASTQKMAERIAINTPIQGSAADLMKIAMIKAHKTLEEGRLKSKLILQIHDELIVDGPKSEQVSVAKILADSMEYAYPTKVKLKVNIHSGTTWADAH